MRRSRLLLETLEARSLLTAAGNLGLLTGISPASDPMGDGVVYQAQVEIVGQTDPGATVLLERAGGRPVARPVTADAQGNFQIPVRLGMGTTALTVVAGDQAGRQGTYTLSVTRANAAIVWNAAALQAIRESATQAPLAARNLAIEQGAEFDAVNAIHPRYSAEHVTVKAAPGTAPDAAATGAAFETLVNLFPGQAAQLEAEYALVTAALPRAGGAAQGLVLGKTVADDYLAWRSTDGASTTVAYTPGTQPGQWVPTPPAYAPALFPQWPNVTPFVLTSSSQFRPAPPPALGSAAYESALAEVQSLGSKTNSSRTADQTQIGLFWNDNAGTETPPGHWNAIAETVALQRHDSTTTDAHNFALLDFALADAGIACWDAKYTYNFWRPITSIHATSDSTWTPLLTTPAFPSYVSGHSTFSAAASTVLSALYGANTHFAIGSDSLPGVTRSYTSFAQAADEAGISRIYGGIHYPFDNQNGLALGQQVGAYVLQHALTPIRKRA